MKLSDCGLKNRYLCRKWLIFLNFFWKIFTLGVVTAASGGPALAAPDVCRTPPTPGPGLSLTQLPASHDNSELRVSADTLAHLTLCTCDSVQAYVTTPVESRAGNNLRQAPALMADPRICKFNKLRSTQLRSTNHSKLVWAGAGARPLSNTYNIHQDQ